MSLTDFWTPIRDICTCLWNCSTTNIVYITDLENYIQSLTDSKEDLKEKYENLCTDTSEAVGQRLRNKDKVDYWKRRGENKIKEVEDILAKGEKVKQNKLGCCGWRCLCTYCFGLKVSEEITEVEKIINKINEFKPVFVRSRGLVEKKDVDTPVGPDVTLDQIWKHIAEDYSVGMVAIYGMGGIGKTTLLKRINNKFLNENYGFDAVIWVDLAGKESLEHIQEVVRRYLVTITDDVWENETEEGKASLLREALERKKFLLLLDDQRNELDLLTAGVPRLDNTRKSSKIVFTTRSEDLFGKMKEVCGDRKDMERIKVKRLEESDALQLLHRQLDRHISDDAQVKKHAAVIAKECKGLPLALKLIGRSMSMIGEPEHWQKALTDLRSYPSQFPTMKEEVFPALRFSCDNIGDAERQCFLYCSLFPESYQIHKRELVNLWMGEGFIGRFGRMYQARNCGLGIIGKLERACLLESCESKDHITMHDVLRDMALWMYCDDGKNEEKILVQQDDEWNRGRDLKTWRKAEIISLWGPHFIELAKETEFPNCKTMIIRGTKLKELPSGLFKKYLRVLDLSHNEQLTKLPAEVRKLNGLQHLDLSYTGIQELPSVIKNLSNLKNLLVDGTEKLEVLPTTTVIPFLKSLEVFSKMKSICLNVDALLEELTKLTNVIGLGITLNTSRSIKCLTESGVLQGRISDLTVMKCSDFQTLDLSGMQYLLTLEIRSCKSLEHLILTPRAPEYYLSHVVIHSCSINNLTCLVHAKLLQTLELYDCPSIAGILDDGSGRSEIEETQSIFSNLKHLTLRYLEKLNTICRPALPFSRLITIEVFKCRQLRKLPFKSNCDRSYFMEIRGEESWWKELIWEDTNVENFFASKFVRQVFGE